MEAEVNNSFISHSKYVKVLNKLASSKTLFKTFACLLATLQNNEEIISFWQIQLLLKKVTTFPTHFAFFLKQLSQQFGYFVWIAVKLLPFSCRNSYNCRLQCHFLKSGGVRHEIRPIRMRHL